MVGVVLAVVIILIILTVLAVTPGLAERVNEWLVRARDSLSALALAFVGWITKYWSLRGRQEAESRWANRNVNKEVKKRARKLKIDDLTIIDALALPLTLTAAQYKDKEDSKASSSTSTQTSRSMSTSAYDQGVPPAYAQPQSSQEDAKRINDIARVLVIRKQVADEYGLGIRRRQNQVQDEADQKEQSADTDDNTNSNQEVEYEWVAMKPTDSDIVTAWSIRFVYIALVLVCVTADYVFTSSRAPTVIGGGSFTPPEFLRGLFQILPVITGVLFVAVAALSGMLIDEFVVAHSNYVKIWPFIAKSMRIIGLVLAVAMFIIDVIAVIFLVIVGFSFQENLGLPLYTVLIVLVSIAIVIALGVLLAFPGLWQGLSALVLLFILGILALIAYALALIAVVFSAIVALMAEINRLIWGRVSDPPPSDAHPDTRNLAIVGYKRGNNWAIELCQHFAKLYGANIWLAGTSETSTDSIRQQKKIFNRLRAHDVTPTRGNTGTSIGLAQNLISAYSGKRSEEVKPLLWIADGTELRECLAALQDLGSAKQHPNVKNVRLALFWVISPSASDDTDIQDLAADLQDWAMQGDSILKTVIVYQKDAPIVGMWQKKTDEVIARGLASLLGGGLWSPENSFAAVINELRKSGYIFSYLSAGSIGVDPAEQDFQSGFASGLTGHINPSFASDRMSNLAGKLLEKQACQTVSDSDMALDKPPTKPQRPASNDQGEADRYEIKLKLWQDAQSTWQKQQAKVFVNIVVPSAKNAFKKEQRKLFHEEVCDWLSKNYGIYAQNVVVEPIQADKDHGIDISNPMPEWAGEYYFSMTALRGVVDAAGMVNAEGVVDTTKALPAIPHDLRKWHAPAPERSNAPVAPGAATNGNAASGYGAPNTVTFPETGVTSAPVNSGGYGAPVANGDGTYGTPAGNMGGYPSYGQYGPGAAGSASPPPPLSRPLGNSGPGGPGAPIGNNPTIPRSYGRVNPASSIPASGYQDPNSDNYQNPTSGAYPDNYHSPASDAYPDANNNPWGYSPTPDQQSSSDRDS